MGCRAFTDAEIGQIQAGLHLRDRALFVLGVKSGFRISELLSLRVSDVMQYGAISPQVTVARRHMKKKTQSRTVPLHADARAILLELITAQSLKPHHYLFRSRKGANRALGRIAAWKILRAAAAKNELTGKVGTHSLRKTFASKVYNKLGHDLLKTQKALGHKSINSTVAYLSFRQEDVDAAILDI